MSRCEWRVEQRGSDERMCCRWEAGEGKESRCCGRIWDDGSVNRQVGWKQSQVWNVRRKPLRDFSFFLSCSNIFKTWIAYRNAINCLTVKSCIHTHLTIGRAIRLFNNRWDDSSSSHICRINWRENNQYLNLFKADVLQGGRCSQLLQPPTGREIAVRVHLCVCVCVCVVQYLYTHVHMYVCRLVCRRRLSAAQRRRPHEVKQLPHIKRSNWAWLKHHRRVMAPDV